MPTRAAPAPLAEFLAIARELRDGDNIYIGQAPMRELERRLAQEVNEARRVPLLISLSGHEVRQGRPADAARHADEAVALLEPAFGRAAPGSAMHAAMLVALQARALAYIRLAEDRNCVAHHAPDSCIFPIEGGGVHVDPAPAQEALRSLLRYLELEPGDVGARWLLNIVAMTLGRFPDAVPAALRIDPARHQARQGVPRFRDVAPLLGVDTFNLAGGVIVDDFDGDGFLDIVTSTSDPFGPLTHYRNRGDGRFEDVSAASRTDQQLGGLNTLGGDCDNDGDVDVLVLRGAWQFEDGRMRNSLLRNDGRANFTDVTRAAGLAEPAMPTQAAVWGDFDNDGDLDLYVGNEASAQRKLAFPAQLFRNNGDGTFTDVAARSGLIYDDYTKGVTAGDYDDDGDLDLYVSNIGPNRLYRNRGDGTFEDVAPRLGVTAPAGRSFAPWFFDYDNDGDLDLFVGAYAGSVEDIANDFIGLPFDAPPPALYRNDGGGSFTDVALQSGMNHAWLPMGANFGDLDNDGFLDIYLGTGDPHFRTVVPNVMLRNVGGLRFDDVTVSGGFGHLQKGHGIGFADLDHDGDQDIYHQLGGFYPGDRFGNALFENPGGGGRFVKLELRGVESNRLAVGARVTVVVDTPGGPRQVHRAVGSVSSFGGSPVGRLEIGLGDATRIVELKLWWPRSGRRSTYTDVPLDALLRIEEGAAAPQPLPHRTFVLGGGGPAGGAGR